MDKHYMALAIREGEKSRGLCSPNPFVGAIIVKDGVILARGRTQAYGQDHAEIVALKIAQAHAKGATMYVSLEPCCHHGKTPPCTQAIIAAGITRVIAGSLDPNPLVSGKGIQELQRAGIEVEYGIYSDRIRRQNEAFFCYIRKQRPFIIWKIALSLDGKFAALDGSSQWISNEASRRVVHQSRAHADAVLSGIRSVHKDDALLNARGVKNVKQPLRVVLDPALELNPQSRLATSAALYPSLVFYHHRNDMRAKVLSDLGLELIQVKGFADELDLPEVLQVLYRRQVSSILLETGNRLSEAFWQAHLVDKCMIFYGNKILGGDQAALAGLALPNLASAITINELSYRKLGENILVCGYPDYLPQ